MRFLLRLLFACLTAAIFTQQIQAQENDKTSQNPIEKKNSIEDFAGMGMLTTVWLRWAPYQSDNFTVSGYKIYRKDGAGEYKNPIASLGPVTSWTDYGLEKGKKYFYRISAYSLDGKETEMSDELPLETAIKAPFIQYEGEINISMVPTFEILCAIYGEVSEDETEQFKEAIENARRFLWRNSRCQVNFHIAYLIVKDKNISEDDDTVVFEADLIRRGYSHIMPKVVFVKTSKGMIFRSIFLFNKERHYFEDSWTADYPASIHIDNVRIMFQFSWIMCEYLRGIVNQNMKQNIPIINPGGGFRSFAEFIASIRNYENLKNPYIGYIEVFDRDKDGIPDSDERVPLDEARLPSDSRYKDSDNDYLPDMDEMVASIWYGSNNLERDTDNDGFIDGKDPFPLVDFQPVINSIKFIPAIDGKIEDTWKVLSKGCFWSTKDKPDLTIYAGWDESNLYLAMKSNKKQDFALKIKNGAGFNMTYDYRIRWGEKEAILKSSKKPAKLTKHVPVESRTGVSAHWIGTDGDCQMEVKLPVSKEGIKLETAKKLLISITLTNPEEKDEIIYVTGFDEFYEVTLEK